MSDEKKPPQKRPQHSGAGRSGSARSIGEELGELDFEPDALLDSLLSDDPPPAAPKAEPPPAVAPKAPAPKAPAAPEAAAPPAAPPLISPDSRLFSEDEDTHVGMVEDLGLERPPQSADVDDLLDQVAPPTDAPPPEPAPAKRRSTASGEVDALLDNAPPIPAAAPKPPTPAAGKPPRPKPPRPPPPRGAPAPRPPQPAAPPAPSAQAADPGGEGDPFAGAFDDELDFENLDLRADAPLLESEPTPPRSTSVEQLREAIPSVPHEEAELSLDQYEEISDAPTVVGDLSEIDALLASPTVPPPEPEATGESPAPPEPPADSAPAVEASAAVAGALSEDEAAAILESLPPESASSADIDGEQPASAHLNAQGNLDVWQARAEWMENEAHARPDAQSKARGLVVASELWAMAGDIERGREVASEAHAVLSSSAVVQRQSRWLAQADDEWKGAAALLESEARSAPEVEHRAHATYLATEVHRLKLGDTAASQRKLDALVRVAPQDARGIVAKLAGQLAQSASPPKAKLPPDDSLQPLANALASLTHLRGGPAPTQATPLSGAESLRRAAQAGDRAAAAEAARSLTAIAELELAALWLSASLDAPAAETRGRAIESLRRIIEKAPDGAAARRVLAARALEQGDAEAVNTAVSAETTTDVVTPADRVALASLTGGGREALAPWLPELQKDPELAVLSAAATATAAPAKAPAEPLTGSPEVRAAIALGRALSAQGVEGADPSLLSAAVERFANLDDASPAAERLRLELLIQNQSGERVAKALADSTPPDGAEAQRDQYLAAALAYELSGDADRATSSLREALTADPSSEASGRALLQHLPPAESTEVLVGVADAAGDDLQKALLLLEAALRADADDVASALIQRAAEAAPALPFAYRLGEERARTAGDVGKLVEWLRAGRAVSEDPIERSWDAIREALLTAEDDREGASALLGESTAAQPGDVALRELHERLIPTAGAERAKWREEAAELAEGVDQAALLLEAALEHERAGDLPAAAAAATKAQSHGGLARLTAERLAAFGASATDYAEQWLAAAKESEDPQEQRALYARLARLDRLRGEAASALLWDAAIIEGDPGHLPALHRLAHEYVSGARLEDLAPIADKLSGILEGPEGVAQAFIAHAAYERTDNADAAGDVIERVTKREQPPLWALRYLTANAIKAGDDAAILRATRMLADRANRAIDAATLFVRAAEASARSGDLEGARGLLERALELLPEHPTALAAEIVILEKLDDCTGAARALETLSSSSKVERHQLEGWHAAAVLWLDKADDADKGLAALEKAAEIDLTYSDVFERLRAQYVAREDRARLASLLERRLDQTEDPEERVALEVTRGRALAEVGDRDAAKQALAAALDENPDHVDALDAFADVCAQEGDWEGAEQSLIRLARSDVDPARQLESYRRLGALYDGELPNPQRAELAYKEILKREPNDVDAQQKLVFVYGRLGDPAKAVEMATELVTRARSPEEKRERTLNLARVYEEVLEDKRKAETTLDRARKTWPQDGSVLKALAEFYQRHGETTALNVLLDRAANDARRALSTGRFEPGLFSQLATVAELRGGGGAAQIANATLAAIEGREEEVLGAGAAAADPKLDDLLAPELLTLPLRALLKKSADALDAAYAVDPKTMRATPLPQESAAVQRELEQLAARFGISGLSVLASPTIGAQALPMTGMPPQLIVGTELLEHPNSALRDYLLVRALKIIQANACTLSRKSPIELWPTLAGYLSVFAPNWQPPNIDAKKLADTRDRIQRAIARRLDDDVPVLALEVIGSIGNRASQVATAIHQWGDRVALLAIGSPVTAFSAVALNAGHGPPPAEGPDRLKWILRNPEARDLAVFSVSEQYAAARKQVGLDG